MTVNKRREKASDKGKKTRKQRKSTADPTKTKEIYFPSIQYLATPGRLGGAPSAGPSADKNKGKDKKILRLI